MSIGLGIAIAGIWIFAGLAYASSDTTSSGKWIALIAAVLLTIFLK